ncbi:MAG: dihydroorotase [Bacteroidales bacterium]|jgi:dihydroorotase|nr:dihydroorotase [Bacteroidales bacterium]
MRTDNNYFIYNAFVVNEGRIFQGDVLIRDGKISKILKSHAPVEDLLMDDNTLFVDATGKYLLPGVIDAHVHFRQPGLTHKGDMYSESRAAAAGGITSVMDMPNVNPQTTSVNCAEEKFAMAKNSMFTNYSFYIGASNHNWEEIKKIDTSRICGIKLFMGSSTGDMLMSDETVLEKLFQVKNIPIAVHSETESIILHNLQKAKEKYGEDIPIAQHEYIRSEEACFSATEKAVKLARRHGTSLHVLHISTAKELSLFSDEFPNITSEVCAAYLYFDHNDYPRLGTKIKCNPSIKTTQDREALLEAVISGKISAIGSDHAPHTLEEKQNTYLKAPSGIPMVQHTLGLMLEFYKQDKIKLQQIVELMCHAPARIFNIKERGFIREGYFADLVLIDMEKNTNINSDTVMYKCKWSPFENMQLHTYIEKTFVNGQLTFNSGTFNLPAGMPLEFGRKEISL